MPSPVHSLQAAIDTLEAQRGALGDAVVDAALTPLLQQLTALSEAPRESRRQISILFLDVVGSTALSERLDPEDMRGVMVGALGRCDEVVRAHGGTVLQHAGDSLLALFGEDEAREDDAERAVRCGLALLRVAREVGAEVQATHGHAGLDARVGIHSGLVLLAGGVDGERLAHGVNVNIAARMEQTAPPGGLRISHATYAQVRGVFDVQEDPPIAVKGVSEPIRSYLVHGIKPRAFRVPSRGIEGVETRMVGRADDFDVLKDRFLALCGPRRDDDCVEAHVSAVSVVGDPGIGKSRLLYEFANWAESRPEAFLIFQGRSTPQTRGQPYGLLRDILGWRFQFSEADSGDAARRKFENGLAPLFETCDDTRDSGSARESHIHVLGLVIGLDYADSPHVQRLSGDPRQLRNRAFHAASEVLRRMSAAQRLPVVLTLEDLHWTDDASLEFLNYLGEVAGSMKLLAVATARPSFFNDRKEWLGSAAHRRLDLRPLDKTGSRQLADELLRHLPTVPPALRELVVGGAEGNPFFMEELVKMLVDQGAIRTDGDVWRVDSSRLLRVQVPTTLTGVLQVRLDALSPPERRALQQASIIGPVFWAPALESLDTEAAAHLPALASRELIVAVPDTSLAGLREYAFKHQLLHQVTYETVLKADRKAWHAHMAQWFAQLSDDGAADVNAIAAQHYAEAGLGALACEFHVRAAERARSRHANQAALDGSSHALSLLQAVPDDAWRVRLQWRALDVRERTFEIVGDASAQRADLDALAALARAGLRGDSASDAAARRGELALRRSMLCLQLGDTEQQRICAVEAEQAATECANTELRLRARRQQASAIARLGDMESGRALARAGLEEARALGLSAVESVYLSTLSYIADNSGDLAESLACDRAALRLAQQQGDDRRESVVRGNLAVGWMSLGEIERSRDEAEAALVLARRVGDAVTESRSLNLIAEALLKLGADTRALSHAQLALTRARQASARQEEIEAQLVRGDALLSLGRIDEAAASFEGAMERGAAIGEAQYQPDARLGLARVCRARGDLPGAREQLEPLMDALLGRAALRGTNEFVRIRYVCWQVLDALGDPRALAVLRAAYRYLQDAATAISDTEMRQSFLEKPEGYADVARAWAATGEVTDS